MPNKIHDLTGQRFGRLQVIELDKEKSTSHRKYWRCKCDCGNFKSIRVDSLTRGTVFCGCYTRQRNRQTSHYKDITGQRFGKLVAIEPTFRLNTQGKMYWKCKCDCGSIIEIINQDLFAGHSQSCGCLRSQGELKIAQILEKNNIYFERQKQFTDCVFSKKNTKPRFDFYVNNKYLIQYDGRQHFDADLTKNTWNTKEKVQQIQLRDKFKNEYCKKHNIPLIRIPYTHYNNLCLEDLLLETSKFII